MKTWWRKLFPKQEANPPRSLIGCVFAYGLLLAVCFGFLYLAGAALRWFNTP
jgi:hypothetical protein